ncbi:hypothetical protein PBY51_000705 [Eleginops maclovinus]|uniref:Uncharacterized protein n=1 Tax=Eleginops maclovinus TaxID=56733 RepID=A0AAN7XN03_ELEMC|nr:hypothetical protein PBY51_000705 [Eleginops maclovinus]
MPLVPQACLRESNPSCCPAIQFCIRGHRSAKAGRSHDRHKGLWEGSLSHPSRGSVGCGGASERRGRWGMGSQFWGEEAREGGVLTVLEEALRCFSEEFLLPDTPLQPANTTPPC